jgi:hypothetical protein
MQLPEKQYKMPQPLPPFEQNMQKQGTITLCEKEEENCLLYEELFIVCLQFIDLLIDLLYID